MRISDWSSDVCSSDLWGTCSGQGKRLAYEWEDSGKHGSGKYPLTIVRKKQRHRIGSTHQYSEPHNLSAPSGLPPAQTGRCRRDFRSATCCRTLIGSHSISLRSEEHTSELQSLMRTSYAVFCLKKK